MKSIPTIPEDIRRLLDLITTDPFPTSVRSAQRWCLTTAVISILLSLDVVTPSTEQRYVVALEVFHPSAVEYLGLAFVLYATSVFVIGWEVERAWFDARISAVMGRVQDTVASMERQIIAYQQAIAMRRSRLVHLDTRARRYDLQARQKAAEFRASSLSDPLMELEKTWQATRSRYQAQRSAIEIDLHTLEAQLSELAAAHKVWGDQRATRIVTPRLRALRMRTALDYAFPLGLGIGAVVMFLGTHWTR